MEFSIIVGFIFRLINFGIIVAALVYIFNKYLKKTILESIAKHKNFMHDLYISSKNKKTRVGDLEKEIDSSKIDLARIDKNFKKWSDYCEFEKQKTESGLVMIEDELKEKKEKQSQNLSEYFVRRDLFKDSFDSAKGDLVSYYSDVKNQDVYLDNIFTDLREQ